MGKRIRLFAVWLALLAGVFCVYPRVEAAGEYAVYVVHKGSGQVLAEENASEAKACAGLALLPAILIISESIEQGSFDISGDVTVSRTASQVRGSTAFIEANERIPAEVLYKSAAVICAGDAVYALAEAMSGSSEEFVKAINDRLETLGVELVYGDITGTNIEMTAIDAAKIAVALSECECYLKYSGIYMDRIEHENGKETELVNQNRLVRNLQGCRGLATSSSNTAGYCGAFYAERDGCGYVCIVLGAKDAAERFERAQTELEAAFTGYKELRIARAGDILLYDYPITGAVMKGCDIAATSDLFILTANTAEKPECTYDMADCLTAPIAAGDCVGNVRYTDKEGNVVGVSELTVNTDINKAGFWDFFKITAESFMRR